MSWKTESLSKLCSKPNFYCLYIVEFAAELYINPLMTNVPHHIETSQLICLAN